MKKDINKKEGRIDWIDATKGIAIILVVVQHSISNMENLYQINMIWLLKIISQFTMPTFFLINGFLYSSKYSSFPIKGIIRKIKAYYIPFLEYNMFFLLLHNLFVKINFVNERFGGGEYSAKEYAKQFVFAFGKRQLFSGALWFLGSILIISVIFILIDFVATKFVKDKWRIAFILAVILCVATLGIFGVVPTKMKLQRSFTDIVFFFVGYMLKEYNFFEIKQWKKVCLVLLAFAITCWGVLNYSIGISKSRSDYPLYYVLGLFGALLLIFISRTHIVSGCELLKYIGKTSMEIMALHLFAFKIVSVMVVYINNYDTNRIAEYPVIIGVDGLWWVAYTASGIIIPVGFKAIKDMIRNGKRKEKTIYK